MANSLESTVQNVEIKSEGVSDLDHDKLIRWVNEADDATLEKPPVVRESARLLR